jgi:hypothetical protein
VSAGQLSFLLLASRCDEYCLSHVAVIFKLVGDESGDVSPRSHKRSRL